jgi:hypothetical protein
MRLKDYWLEIITVTFTALMIMVAVANAQDVAVISTGQSDQIYPVGTHDQPVPTPKPVGLNAARLTLSYINPPMAALPGNFSVAPAVVVVLAPRSRQGLRMSRARLAA